MIIYSFILGKAKKIFYVIRQYKKPHIIVKPLQNNPYLKSQLLYFQNSQRKNIIKYLCTKNGHFLNTFLSSLFEQILFVICIICYYLFGLQIIVIHIIRYSIFALFLTLIFICVICYSLIMHIIYIIHMYILYICTEYFILILQATTFEIN